MADGGRKHNKQLREAGVCMGLDYHNQNPWFRLLGRANECEIKIDGKIGIALIDSGAMISMMSRSTVTNMGMRYNLYMCMCVCL